MIRRRKFSEKVLTSAPSERKAKRLGHQAAGRMPTEASSVKLGTLPHPDLHGMKRGETHDLAQVDRAERLACGELEGERQEHLQAEEHATKRKDVSETKAENFTVRREALPKPRFGPVISTRMVLLNIGLLMGVEYPLTMLGLVHLTLPRLGILFLTVGIGAVIVLAADALGLMVGRLASESGLGNSERTEMTLWIGIVITTVFLFGLLVGFNLWRYENFLHDIGVPALAGTITLFFLQLLVAAIAFWVGLIYHDSAEHRQLDEEITRHEDDAADAQDEAEEAAEAAAGIDKLIDARKEAAAHERELLKALWPQRAWAWVRAATDRRPDLADHLQTHHQSLWPDQSEPFQIRRAA